MSKIRLFFPLFLLLIMAGLLFIISTEKQGSAHPSPTEFGGDESEFHQQKRIEWIKRMHRAAPGVDTKSMDDFFRFQRYSNRSKTKSNQKIAVPDTLANGQLIGEWKERGANNISGRIHIAELDTLTQTLFAASAGGNVWKGNLNGNNWISINDNLQFDNIIAMRHILLGNGNTRLLVGCGGRKIFYTDDEGLNWNLSSGLTNVAGWGYIRRMVTVNDSLNTVYMLAQEWDTGLWAAITSLYRSQNHGTSFSKIISWPEASHPDVSKMDIWTARYGQPTVYFVKSDSVFTLNPGTGLPVSRGILPTSSINRIFLTGWDSTSTTWLYAYDNTDLFRSNDAGFTWSQISSPAYSLFSQNSFSVSLTDRNRLYIGDVECHVSSDGGISWQVVNTWGSYYANVGSKLHADIPGILPLLNSGGTEITLVGTDGGLYKSNDRLQTVQNLSLSGLNTAQYYSVYTSRSQPHTLFAGSQDQGFQKGISDPPHGLLNLSQVVSGDYGHIISSNLGQSIWMVYPGFVSYYANSSSSGSERWTFTANADALWIPPLMSDPDAANISYMAGGAISLGGSRIIKLEGPGGPVIASDMNFDFQQAAGGGIITAMAWSPANKNKWYVLTENGKTFYSNDRGQTWNLTPAFAGPGNHYFYGAAICPDPVNPERVYLGGAGYSNPGFFRSDDGGLTFSADTIGLPPTLIFELAASQEGKYIFAATEVGPFMYVRNEHKWYNMSGNSTPDQTYWSVDYFFDTFLQKSLVRFGTYGRGIWDFSYSDLIFISEESPEEFDVQVYPNPASSFIQVQSNSPFATIRIFNEEGRLVMEKNPAGAQINQIGLEHLPKGIYLVECLKGENRKIQKIVLL